MRFDPVTLVHCIMTSRSVSRQLTLTIALTMMTSAAIGQQGLSAKYGSREPRTCPSKKEPAKGVLSPEQAGKYLACNAEGEIGSNLYLLQDIKVEVGKGTPFLQLSGAQR